MNISLKMILAAVILAGFLLGGLSQQAAATRQAAHWSYSGKDGPDHWGELDPKFAACSEGKNQSPLNLTGFIKADLEPLKFDYNQGGAEILNNGHTIQVNYQPGSSFSIGARSFELKQFHFHAPSENLIEGKSFPMEAHFVHADIGGNLAVIAVLFEEGKQNEELSKAWDQMPEREGETNELKEPVSAPGLLPKKKDYYRFNGSLTTPPCSEGVIWLVMKEPMKASKEQIEKFAHTMHHPNNRPVQPLHARVILK